MPHLGAVSEVVTTLTRSAESVERFAATFPADFERLLGSIARAADDGIPLARLRDAVGPVRELFGRSPLVQRLQQWPRGYPGDFETIEYLCGNRNAAAPGTIAHVAEAWALACPPSAQHRAKIDHQAERIFHVAESVPEARILSIACGPCGDLRRIQERLRGTDAKFWLNDADADALAYAASHLRLAPAQYAFVPGNVFRVQRQLAALGPFDLVIAGGLFDYLPDRYAQRLVEFVHARLLAPGGTFFFTNIAAGNPYRAGMEVITNWELIERSEAEVGRLCRASGAADVVVTRDSTGLALLVTTTATRTGGVDDESASVAYAAM